MSVPPPDHQRSQHPLEREPRPASPPPSGSSGGRQRVTLIIPSVRPVVTYIILAINISIFILRAFSPALDLSLLQFGANNQIDVLFNGEAYRLVTSMFLHASIHGPEGTYILQNALHLIFNCSIIYYAGTSLERLFGHGRYLSVYLLGGVTGSILSVILGGPNAYSVGASGAVFAILGAEFIYLYHHRRLLGAGGRERMKSLIILALINLAFGFFTGLSEGGLRIDNAAHLGGLVGGLILAWFISPIYIPRPDPKRPNVLVADDINPLRMKIWVLSVYGAALLMILLIARQSLAI